MKKHNSRTILICEHLLVRPHIYTLLKFNVDKKWVKGAICNFCKQFTNEGKSPPQRAAEVCISCFEENITYQLN